MFSLGGALTSIPYVALAVSTVVASGLLWNTLIENPSIRAEARNGYVAVAELTAAKAELAERERQAVAAIAAGNNFAAVLREQSAAMEKKASEQERLDRDYEAKLKAAGRSCLLTDADIRELSK
jgi:hypothetical protein